MNIKNNIILQAFFKVVTQILEPYYQIFYGYVTDNGWMNNILKREKLHKQMIASYLLQWLHWSKVPFIA